MRTNLGFLLGVLLGTGLTTAAAQRAKDAVIVDPEVHKVVLENEHVRVIDARISPGLEEPDALAFPDGAGQPGRRPLPEHRA